MTIILLLLALIALPFAVLFGLSLCASARLGEERMREMFEEEKKDCLRNT